LWVHTNEYYSQVVANTTASIVTFSILSPDASLSYDRIKLRLEEYRTLLSSYSDTITLSTENGKTVICRRQAKEMEQFLDRAEVLLRDAVQSRDISTLVVLHHLRDLAEVLDNLKLYDECQLTGNCVLELAEALGRRSLDFKQEQAETLALIAGLSVYQPRARTLFTQAISIYEEVVANNASHANKNRFLIVLDRAGYWASGHLRAQWLERAIQLMTKELPQEMVHPQLRSVIYNNYGIGLYRLKQCAGAIEALHEAISIRRTLINKNPSKYNHSLARTLMNMGKVLDYFGKYDDAVAAVTYAKLTG
jgi:tetratricopeptide (TPR) repeat protein